MIVQPLLLRPSRTQVNKRSLEIYENLLSAGVIDPTKVVRFALQNAASVSGLMLTTEAMIAEKPAKKKAPAMPGGMDEDMY